MDALRNLPLDEPSPQGMIFRRSNGDGDCFFVPARLIDNPYMDQADYLRKLARLPPVTRARLMAGDWSISEAGQIQADWLRYYDVSGEHYRADFPPTSFPNGLPLRVIHPSECVRFCTVDTAGSTWDVERESKGFPQPLV